MGIQIPPDSTGKTVETNSPDSLTQRQVVTLGDPAIAEEQVTVSDGQAEVRDPDVRELLMEILMTLKEIKQALEG